MGHPPYKTLGFPVILGKMTSLGVKLAQTLMEPVGICDFWSQNCTCGMNMGVSKGHEKKGPKSGAKGSCKRLKGGGVPKGGLWSESE